MAGIHCASFNATDPHTISADLESGKLCLNIVSSDLPYNSLCGLASRQNPKRGFLFISKVLGRHYPARPSQMRETYRILAAKIPTDLLGPVLVIGLAETAICLGAGVHEEYLRRSGRADVLFLHTTRYWLSRPLACEFQEEHSHAPHHLIYQPVDANHSEWFQSAKSLIIVDDEASTGNTMINLARALRARLPALESAVCVTLTDWRSPQSKASFQREMPLPSTMVSLLEGNYTYTANPHMTPEPVPDVIGNAELKDDLIKWNNGRLGYVTPQPVAAPLKPLQTSPGQRILVLGTGEFVYPPFLLAESLERAGAEVFCQATTRSPIKPGHAIHSAISFPDNYADGIRNFLYNVNPDHYDQVIACYETEPGETHAALNAALGATAILASEIQDS